MAEAERDLGTRLEWVAANHYDTDHPHAHVVLRGKTMWGEDLVIPRAYMSHGLRRRASEVLTRELGPETSLEVHKKLTGEIEKERFTRLDRRLLAASHEHVLKLDAGLGDGPLFAARLRRLEQLGLVSRETRHTWRLDPRMEHTLRCLGERGDIIKTLHRHLREKGLERPIEPDAVWDGRQPEARAFEGRLVSIGVSDELTDAAYVVIDGLDGKVRYADLGSISLPTDMRPGDLVTVSPAVSGARKVDHTIAHIAEQTGGRYDDTVHRAYDPKARTEFIRAHVRRLEALRRGRLVSRDAEGTWTIPADYLERAEAYERARTNDAPARLQLIADVSFDVQVKTDGATWLDHRLAGEGEQGLAKTGVGGEARAALAERRAWLVRAGLLPDANPVRRLSDTSLAELKRRELARVAWKLRGEIGRPFTPAQEGERIEGRYVRSEMSGMGKLAVIERAHDFTLVPWRDVLERNRGKMVSGVIRGGAVSWDLTRRRTIGR